MSVFRHLRKMLLVVVDCRADAERAAQPLPTRDELAAQQPAQQGSGAVLQSSSRVAAQQGSGAGRGRWGQDGGRQQQQQGVRGGT
jgi:hypothetical protein